MNPTDDDASEYKFLNSNTYGSKRPMYRKSIKRYIGPPKPAEGGGTRPVLGSRKPLTFQGVDSDGNGTITRKEAEMALRNMTPAQQQADPFASKVLNSFATVDKDGDGIEQKEANFAMGDRPRLRQPIDKKYPIKKKTDGGFTINPVIDPMATTGPISPPISTKPVGSVVKPLTFERVDSNADGYISRQEASAALGSANAEQLKGDFAQKVLNNYDAVDRDGNGAVGRKYGGISQKEANFAMTDRATFGAIDTDGNKVISKDEAIAAANKYNNPVTGRLAQQVANNFGTLDLDGNGSLSQIEAQGPSGELTFGSLDRDGNGTISSKEAQAAAVYAKDRKLQAGSVADRVINNFGTLDDDGNGSLTREEIVDSKKKKSIPKDLNFYADTDGNGRISAQEAGIALQNATPEQRNGQFAQKVLGNIASADKNGDGVDMREAGFAMYGNNPVTQEVKPWQAGGFRNVQKGSTPTDPATGGEGTDSTVTNPLETGGIPAANNDGTGDIGPQIGAAPGSTEQEDAINRQNQFYDKLADRQKEKKEFNTNKPTGKIEDVNIGKAAQKSAAMLAFDVNQNGKLSQAERSMMASGDRNNNGVVGKKGLEKFVKEADTNKSGIVSVSEVRNQQLQDVNNNNNVSNVEERAFKLVAGSDGHASVKDARDYLKQQAEKGAIDNKAHQTAEQLAKEIIAKAETNKAGGGSGLPEANGALASGAGQVAKSKNGKGDDGPGKKKPKK